MKKLIIVAVTLLLALSVVGCSAWKSGITDFGGEVKNNGGFAVEKGEYVYFINGTSSNTDDNSFGKVVKGSIARVRISEIGSSAAKAETVVPKIVYGEYFEDGAGLFIVGDYVYYPTPSDKKNSQGVVKNTDLEFRRTKLDGSDSSIIATVSSLSAPYRFYEKDGKAFLTVYVTVTEDGKDVDYLKTYDEKGKEIFKSKNVASYDFGDFGADYAYYVRTAYNETLKQDESYNEVYRYAFDGSGEALVLNGKGGYPDNAGGIGTQGATFDIIKNTVKDLYVSITYVDTSVATATVYCAIAQTDVKTAKEGDVEAYKLNLGALTVINDGDVNASKIFAASSVYVSKSCIIYNDADYGLVKYDYTVRDTISDGLSHIFDNDDVKGYTYQYEADGYLYYTDGTYYYRVALSDIVDENGAVKADGNASVERLTYKTTYADGEWYRAEFVGGKMLYMNDAEPYYGYVYSVGLNDVEVRYGKALAEITDDEIDAYVEELAKTDKTAIDAALAQRVGIIDEDDAQKLDAYYKDTFED